MQYKNDIADQPASSSMEENDQLYFVAIKNRNEVHVLVLMVVAE